MELAATEVPVVAAVVALQIHPVVLLHRPTKVEQGTVMLEVKANLKLGISMLLAVEAVLPELVRVVQVVQPQGAMVVLGNCFQLGYLTAIAENLAAVVVVVPIGIRVQQRVAKAALAEVVLAHRIQTAGAMVQPTQAAVVAAVGLRMVESMVEMGVLDLLD